MGCGEGEVTLIVGNAYVTSPRRWNPQAATSHATATAATMARFTSDDHIDKPPWHDLYESRGCSVAVLRHLRRSSGTDLDLFLGGARRDDQLAPQLAVHLQHKLHFVLRQRGGVDLRPRRVEQRAELGRKAQFVPQRAADVRDDRVEHAQQDRQALSQERARADSG